MARFLLIHGSCHGAWCWRDVVPLLVAQGHEVRALDLPGHGDAPAAPEPVTAATWVEAILAAAEPETVLVGHSLGGMWITLAAEAAPERFARLVYVAAWVARDGMSTDEMGARYELSDVGAAMIRSADGTSFTFAEESHERIFYHDCPPGTTAYARRHLRPEPTGPLAETLRLTGRHLQVPRSYVRCPEDRAILDRVQRDLVRDWPEEDVFTMACGHSPFFADPEGLAAILDRVGRAA